MEKTIGASYRDFKDIDIENKNELLKFFTRAYYNNERLLIPYAEEHGLYDDIFNKLSGLYKPVTEDKQALFLKSELKKNPDQADQEMEAFLIIEQIMVGLKGHIGVTKDVVNELLRYHYKYNKEFVIELFMDELTESIGNEVKVVGKNNGKYIMENGVLREVNPGNFIELYENKKVIPFIGFKQYLIEVKDKYDKVLYRNYEDLDLNKLIDTTDIDEAKYKVMGVKKQSKKKK